MLQPVTHPSIWQWSDRWAPDILSASQCSGPTGCTLESPYYYAREILGIIFTLTTTAVVANRYMNISLTRAGVRYAHQITRVPATANSIIQYAFQRGIIHFALGLVNFELHEPLAENFLWLPNTTLSLAITNGDIGDVLSNIAVTSRKWRVA